MSSIYHERVLKRIAKLMHKHGIDDHEMAADHVAFAKEYKKRSDCWEHLFKSAVSWKERKIAAETEDYNKSSKKNKKKSRRHRKSSEIGKELFKTAMANADSTEDTNNRIENSSAEKIQFNESLNSGSTSEGQTKMNGFFGKSQQIMMGVSESATKEQKRRRSKKKRNKGIDRLPELGSKCADELEHLPEIGDKTQQKPKHRMSIMERLAKGGMVHSTGEWIKMKDEHGHTYYYNKKTNRSQWESPFQYQKVPPPWTMREEDGFRWYTNNKTGQQLQEARTGAGDVYYYDHETGESQWEKPWEKIVKEEVKVQDPKTKYTISGTSSKGYNSSSIGSHLPSIHRKTSHYHE